TSVSDVAHVPDIPHPSGQSYRIAQLRCGSVRQFPWRYRELLMWKGFSSSSFQGLLCPSVVQKNWSSLQDTVRPIPLDLPSPPNHDAAEHNKEKQMNNYIRI